MVLLLLLSLASLFCMVPALDIQGKIRWTELCPGPRELGSAKVVLDDGSISAGVTHDGSFMIPDVAVGTYVLSVLARNHAFDQVRIDVVEHSPVPEVRPYIIGTPLDPPASIPLAYPAILVARHKYDYFVPRESFNLIGMFQNPMMLIMVVGAVMMLAMPYIMKNIDPEVMQEIQNRRGKVDGMQNPVRNGDTRSGHTQVVSDGAVADSDGSSIARSSPTNAPQTSRNRSGKNKRR